MRRLPPLSALKAFEATARLSSVTAAAEELGVTHSAVSQQIGLLEDYFGQKLFVRPGRRIEPAPAALALLEDVRLALDRIAIASEHLARRGMHRIFSISATTSFALRWLIPRIAAFQKEQSSIELRLVTSVSDGIGHMDEAFDFIIRREPMQRSEYACRRLVEDSMTPLMSPDLFARHRFTSASDLTAAPLIHMRSRPDAWKRWLVAQGADVQDTLEGPFFDHFFLTLEAALQGMGIALAPRALVERDIDAGRLVAPFPDLTLDGPGFHVLYRAELEADRHAQKVLDWLLPAK